MNILYSLQHLGYSIPPQADAGWKPRETDNLVEKLFYPPTGTVNANDAGKKLSNLYIEQVNIKSIQYTDGSVRQADSK